MEDAQKRNAGRWSVVRKNTNKPSSTNQVMPKLLQAPRPPRLEPRIGEHCDARSNASSSSESAVEKEPSLAEAVPDVEEEAEEVAVSSEESSDEAEEGLVCRALNTFRQATQ